MKANFTSFLWPRSHDLHRTLKEGAFSDMAWVKLSSSEVEVISLPFLIIYLTVFPPKKRIIFLEVQTMQ